MSDQLVAEAATYTTHNKHNRPTSECSQRDSNPQSQLSIDRRPYLRTHGHWNRHSTL